MLVDSFIEKASLIIWFVYTFLIFFTTTLVNINWFFMDLMKAHKRQYSTATINTGSVNAAILMEDFYLTKSKPTLLTGLFVMVGYKPLKNSASKTADDVLSYSAIQVKYIFTYCL